MNTTKKVCVGLGQSDEEGKKFAKFDDWKPRLEERERWLESWTRPRRSLQRSWRAKIPGRERRQRRSRPCTGRLTWRASRRRFPMLWRGNTKQKNAARDLLESRVLISRLTPG